MLTEGGWVQLEGYKELSVCNILSGYYLINENGEVISKQSRKKLLPKTDKDGYLCLNLCTNELVGEREHKRKTFRVAGLVLREFKGNPPTHMADPTVEHKDGNKRKNHISNLCWMERVQNSASRKDVCQGEKNGSAKLTESDVRQIKCYLASSNLSLRDIANKFGVERSTIFAIKKGKTWKHIGSTGRV